METISYFDNIVDFKFDPDSKSIKMTMPFRWQKDFVEQIPLLHAEIFIPKEFSELAGQELGGLINGIEDPIFVDRSPPDEVVVHYMTPKNRLLNLSEMITNDGMQDDIVEFGLVSMGAVEEEDGKPLPMPVSTGDWSPVMQTSTSGESILVEVQWSPLTIKADEDVTFKLKFIDPESNEEIENVRFDIMLYDPDENHVDASHRSKQTTYTQTYTFDRTGAFTLLITNVNFSGESAEFHLSVVPEFPVGILIATGVMIAGMLALVRYKGPAIKI